MNKSGFEHQGNSTYLVYELGPEDSIDSMSLGMILNNCIPGLAPAILTQSNEKKLIKYDVTARVPASQYLLGTVNKKRILGVFSGILQAFLAAEDYMIDVQTIALELDSIFTNVATADTVLLCVPVVAQEAQELPDLRAFFKNILFNVQYDERENRDYVTKLVNHLNGVPVFSVSEFKSILDYISSDPMVAAPDQESKVSAAIGSQPAASIQAVPFVSSPYEPEQLSKSTPTLVPVSKQIEAMPESTEKEEKAEDQISLFYLLQHYNKDNAAKYKAQKEKKKSEKKAGKAKEKKAKLDSKPTGQAQNVQSFSIPGQDRYPVESVIGSGASPTPSVEVPISQPAPKQPISVPMQRAPTVAIEETLYFSESEGDETVLLGHESQVRRLTPHLVRIRNNERIPIDKEIFRLGRDADYNDYAIADNRYIGHGHCHILSQNGEFFIVDDNSKNHTKVDGKIIAPGVQVKLVHGCTISVADEKFEFKLY